ncbi:protein Star isoform X2 [Temnothorax longispinosus]|uniref:protein Star isoform X2 n=1 Tax=Temnothorax longispinosus TaxID=300112 RepID=UPI003A99C04A
MMYPRTSIKQCCIRGTTSPTEYIILKFRKPRYGNRAGEKWYNKKNISALSPEAFHDLLTDIQQNWMIWNHDPDEPYELQEPDVEDPSMGQSTVIREIFNDKKNGFFIECGAYDGEMRSNTLFLERFNGWSGLLIEADPINFTKMLQKNRKAYLSPTCLSVTKSPTVATFLMARNIGRLHEPENTTENAPAENTLDVAYTGEHIRVQCLPLTLYIAALGVETVDYFSLDIEGNEIDVLETIPFNEVDIKALSVEYIHNAKGRKYLIDMMDHRGYYVYSFVEHPDNLANDIIFVKRNT